MNVLFAGVCGTDIAIFNGEYKVPLPIVLGHEFVGVVAEVGEPEFSYLEGETAVAEINNTCLACNRAMLCPACERGLPNHCLERT
ncbi:alcohol dehydrogenase catalytic domain-containing protein, partial [Candidatus Sumerlaeota bacterium]|nr:alcohol dehydrogenase catalytic domain-containing protein [Candidatus Sumerlaeota bacterium]